MANNNKINQAKTIEEHREYLYEIVRLKLFFMWHWLHDFPEESVSKVLRERIDIFRKTAVNPGLLNPIPPAFEQSEWLLYEKKLKYIYQEYQNNADAFEQSGGELFKPSLDERLKKDFNDTSSIEGYQCGSLRYNLLNPKQIHETIDFHIANAIQPRSIFEDRNYLPECFLKLMNATEKLYGCTRLRTQTWLNSLPRWLELFPEEWQNNLSEEIKDVQWHYGFWGQFITARGTFNFKYAKILRETGKLPFYPRTSTCSFEAMREHLKSNYDV